MADNEKTIESVLRGNHIRGALEPWGVDIGVGSLLSLDAVNISAGKKSSRAGAFGQQLSLLQAA